MQVEVIEVAEGSRTSGPELWVRVLSNQMVDLPRVRQALTDEQRETWAGYSERPVAYYPHHVTEAEQDEHGYKYEDHWTFPAKRSV